MHAGTCRFRWVSRSWAPVRPLGKANRRVPRLCRSGGLPADHVGEGVRVTFQFVSHRNNAVQSPVRRGPAERRQDVS